MRFLLTSALLLAIPAWSLAKEVTTLDDLEPGDPYRLVFVTSAKRDATSSDIEVYNEFVRSGAAVGLITAGIQNADWSAIASTEGNGNTARENTETLGSEGVRIFLIGGMTKIADSYDDLWDGTIDNPINLDENGNEAVALPWTGTFRHGFDGVNLGSSISPFATIGNTAETNDGRWIAGVPPGADFKINLHPLYGISSVQTVAVPEPSTLFGVAIGAIFLVSFRRRR